MGFFVLFIMLLLILSVTTELPDSTKTSTLAHPAGATGLSKKAPKNILKVSKQKYIVSNLDEKQLNVAILSLWQEAFNSQIWMTEA